MLFGRSAQINIAIKKTLSSSWKISVKVAPGLQDWKILTFIYSETVELHSKEREIR